LNEFSVGNSPAGHRPALKQMNPTQIKMRKGFVIVAGIRSPGCTNIDLNEDWL
jgi:hypothetical protein